MITRQQYLQAFAHPDIFVRSGVLRMFSEDLDPGLDVTYAAVAALKQFGVEEAFEFPHLVTDLSIDEESIAFVLETAAALGDTKHAFHLLRWVCTMAPVAVLEQWLQRIEAIADGKFESFPKMKELAQRRVEIHHASPVDCIARLCSIPGRCNEMVDFPRGLIDESLLLCQRLVEAGECRAELEGFAREWLNFDFDSDFGERHWFSGIGIELAGMLQMEAMIPRIIEHFDYDWDWWNEAIQSAVGRMKSLEAMEICAEIYPSLEWHGRLYLGNVFESPRFPEFEPRLTSLLDQEPSDDLRVNLAAALAMIGSASARKKARSVFREDLEDPERFIIAELLYTQLMIEGGEDRELPRWRARMEEMRLISTEPFGNYFDNPMADSDWLGFQSVEPKVGRNDLCPCGSGKKYKKCCLKP